VFMGMVVSGAGVLLVVFAKRRAAGVGSGA
jgi:hypothetical protein